MGDVCIPVPAKAKKEYRLHFSAQPATSLLHKIAGSTEISSQMLCHLPVEDQFFQEVCQKVQPIFGDIKIPVGQLCGSIQAAACERLPVIAAEASELKIREKSNVNRDVDNDNVDDTKVSGKKVDLDPTDESIPKHKFKAKGKQRKQTTDGMFFKPHFIANDWSNTVVPVYDYEGNERFVEKNERTLELEERHWRQEAIIIEIVKRWIDEDVRRQNRPICLVDVGAYGGEMAYLFHTSIDVKPERVVLIDPSKPIKGWLIEHHPEFMSHKSYKRFEAGVGDVSSDDLAPYTKPSSSSEDGGEDVTPLIIVVAKHLCGYGGDDLITSSIKWDADLLVFAHCCQQNCHWDTFVGREQFEGMGLNEKEFKLLCSKTNWKSLQVLHKIGKKSHSSCQRHMYQVGAVFEQIFAAARQNYITSVGKWSEAVSFLFCDQRDSPKNIALVATREGKLPTLVEPISQRDP